MRTIRVGSRESRLAMIQAELVMEAIRAAHPELRLELVTMKTTGDKILHKTLDQIGGKGLFVKELDEALLRGRVDICVHSYKDLPIGDNPDLPVVATGPREDPRDVLILPERSGEIDFTRPVGCASQRRRLQMAELYPHWPCRPVRGNVLTRLDKLDRGEYGGLVLAAAGIKRLGLLDRVSRYFEPEECLPSACQGILAVQARAGEDMGFLDCFHSGRSWDISRAERAFTRTLDGGCSSPVAVYGVIRDKDIILSGMYVDGEKNIYRGQITGPRDEGEHLGRALALELKERGNAHE